MNRTKLAFREFGSPAPGRFVSESLLFGGGHAARAEGFILKIKRLPPIDRREAAQ
jgi:hypothetical protein